MWVYLLLLLMVLILLIISVVYVVRLTHNFLIKYVKNKITCWFLSFIPILLFILGICIDLVNAVVVDIHLILIVSVIKFLFLLIKKMFNKHFSEYVILGIGVILTAIILIRGYYQAYTVSKTYYEIITEKDLGVDKFRIVQISDSHMGTTMDGNIFSKYMDDVNDLNPDIVVITGDFIDDDTSMEDIKIASAGLGKLKTKYGVYFVYGNHDKGYYSKNKGILLKEELEKNNVVILEDKSVDINNNIIIVGRQDREVKDRIDAVNLTKNLDKSKYIIMLDHQPNDYKNEEKAMVDLVLSGHTHGGQLIPLGQFGLLLGSNDSIYGMKKSGHTTFIVNSGISDWAIKFKTGTKSEYVIVDIKN